MRAMNTAVAAAMLAGIGTPMGNAGWSGGKADQSSGARALRERRRGSQRGTPAEQSRRITAAHDKRARKNAARIVVAEARDYWTARRDALVA